MLAATGRCLAIWLKVTLVLAAVVAGFAIVAGVASPAFKVTVVVAVLLELAAIRGLAREWAFDAKGNWWWPW
jgi:hypothetical protein